MKGNDTIIPFNRPAVVGKELEYIAEVIREGHAGGDGRFTTACHRLLEVTLGVRRAFLTTSCTDALEMAALLLEVGPGDEVIVPAFTFVSTVNAFVLRGATPRFADIRADTLNLDDGRLEDLITPRTKAVVPVHYAGVGCEMDAIGRVAARHGVSVVEDNAHGLFAKYRGRSLGTFGALATLSFHETKSFTCGEGGALLINDERFVRRAEILREKGTNRSQFRRGEVEAYTWVDVGSSYLPSDILAAFLLAQLEARETIQSRRRQLWHRYFDSVAPWAAEHGVRLPAVPAHCEQAYHMFYLILPTAETRRMFIAHLQSNGISAVFHYLPLHLSPMGRRFGGRDGDCPVTEHVAQCLVRLPFYNDLTDADQDRVIDAALGFRC
jgi:dTDP-4-amino-4,6-dideoxygalactose transaminase